MATIQVGCMCPFCGKVHYVELTEEEYIKYTVDYKQKHAIHIQDISPRLTADERELLKTGICHTCWNNAFDDVEEDA